MVDRKPSQDAVLHGIGILIFIHEDPAVFGVKHGSQVGVIGEEAGDVHKQIVEIDCIGCQQHFLIHRPKLFGDFIGGPAPARLETIRCQAIIFSAADDASESIDGRVRQGQAELFGGTLQE